MTEVEERPLRADAERNRRRLLDAAAAVFAEQGLEASVDEIARRAGVGHGTAFRHFPTKDALLAAVVAEGLRELADAAEAALAGDPALAFRRFAELAAGSEAANRALAECSCGLALSDPDVRREDERLVASVRLLLERAQAAGAVRADVTAGDVALLLLGAIRAAEPLRDRLPELWRRYVAVLLDGLRPGSATPLPVPPPSPADLRCCG